MNVTKFTFLSGIELSDTTLMIAAQVADWDPIETPHTLIRMRAPDGNWSIDAKVGRISTGVASNIAGDGIALLAPQGEYLEWLTDGHVRNEVLDNKPDITTTLRFLRVIDGTMYAGGTNNYIFCLANGRWDEIGVDAMRDAPVPRSFDNLVGFNAAELYTFGWEGALWGNMAGQWAKIESPTNLILNDGDVHGDDVYIGGQLGTILKGRGDDWNIIKNSVLTQDIWSVRAFGDAVYFSMASGILRLKDGDLSLFKQLGPDMRTAMSLFVGPSGLWSVGASDIVLFDGEEWHTIAQSD